MWEKLKLANLEFLLRFNGQIVRVMYSLPIFRSAVLSQKNALVFSHPAYLLPEKIPLI